MILSPAGTASWNIPVNHAALLTASRLILRQRGFEEHQFEQVGIVEVLGVAFEESHRGEFGLLDVQMEKMPRPSCHAKSCRSGLLVFSQSDGPRVNVMTLNFALDGLPGK
ncbi:MAG: hypothetical protein ABSE90_10380 [Verrucomicrobiota bacterium]|jgi:hypothetical protein